MQGRPLFGAPREQDAAAHKPHQHSHGGHA
jgi:hypothetical protein